MRRFINKVTNLVVIAALFAGLTTPFLRPIVVGAASSSADIPVQFLGINDFHGQLDPQIASNGTQRNYGGAAYLATNLNTARDNFLSQNPSALNDNSIRVQSGDMVGASPANSGLLQDEPTMKVLEAMDFKVGTLGNHEFDEGLAEYKRILDGGDTTDFGDIVHNYPHQRSSMEIVIGNVVLKSDGKTIPLGFKPYSIKEVGGVKVGFIGVVTTDIPNLVLDKQHKDYMFLDEAETIAKYAKELNDQNVHAIVALVHDNAISTGTATTGAGENTDAGVVTENCAVIMTKVNTLYPDNSVDIVFGGHNHKYANGKVGTTRIVESFNAGSAFADVRGVIDSSTKDFKTTPIADIKDSFNNKYTTPVVANPIVQAIITDANQRVFPITSVQIGTAVQESISRTVTRVSGQVPDDEAPLGNLITDAQVYMANKAGYNVDFAFTNQGGIRADLTTIKDSNNKNVITWGAAQAVQPFGNIMQIVGMKGKDILAVLSQSYRSASTDSNLLLQVSGLKYYFTPKTGDAIFNYEVSFAITNKGEILDPEKTYRIVINDFLSSGSGDKFTEFSKIKKIGAMNPDTETFVSYIKEMTAQGKQISASKEGRKNYVATSAELDQIVAKLVSDQITTLKQPSILEKTSYEAVVDNYSLLTDKQKALVTGYNYKWLNSFRSFINRKSS